MNNYEKLSTKSKRTHYILCKRFRAAGLILASFLFLLCPGIGLLNQAPDNIQFLEHEKAIPASDLRQSFQFHPSADLIPLNDSELVPSPNSLFSLLIQLKDVFPFQTKLRPYSEKSNNFYFHSVKKNLHYFNYYTFLNDIGQKCPRNKNMNFPFSQSHFKSLPLFKVSGEIHKTNRPFGRKNSNGLPFLII